jgi:hypothetical protein
MIWRESVRLGLRLVGGLFIGAVLLTASIRIDAQFQSVPSRSSEYLFNDSHFHLTNYIQEGTDIHDFLKIMGNKAGRVSIFGIPLQQQWSYRVDGDQAPTYHLNSDAPLYYYSFTDASIAMAYKSLSKDEQTRLDPMITGFNPTDMYAADPVRRVLQAFPGVFSGIGEFSIHEEFVSATISGEVASLQDRALDRLLEFAAEAGLVVLIHNDVDTPFAKEGSPPEVAPANQENYLRVYNQYGPLWSLLSKNASEKLRKGNYERIFDEARTRVRVWEKAHSSGFTPHAGK